MPAELQAIHRYVVETPVLEEVTDEKSAVVEAFWRELISKLPPNLRRRSREVGPQGLVPLCRAQHHVRGAPSSMGRVGCLG
jgi:hypothetical protein